MSSSRLSAIPLGSFLQQTPDTLIQIRRPPFESWVWMELSLFVVTDRLAGEREQSRLLSALPCDSLGRSRLRARLSCLVRRSCTAIFGDLVSSLIRGRIVAGPPRGQAGRRSKQQSTNVATRRLLRRGGTAEGAVLRPVSARVCVSALEPRFRGSIGLGARGGGPALQWNLPERLKRHSVDIFPPSGAFSLLSPAQALCESSVRPGSVLREGCALWPWSGSAKVVQD